MWHESLFHITINVQAYSTTAKQLNTNKSLTKRLISLNFLMNVSLRRAIRALGISMPNISRKVHFAPEL